MAITKVTSGGIADGTLSVEDIADDAVTAAKLANSINTDIATGVTANTTANAALPKAGGTMTGGLDLNDNVKARFGTGNDLEIYHDGSNSYIDDTGTGYLKIKTSDRLDLQSATGEKMIRADANGEVTLYHNDAAKLATSATGVTVTGVVAATTLTGDGSALTGLSSFDPDGAVVFNESGADVDFRVEGDTDANALFVQGSDSKVGIGTGNPDANLHIKSSATNLPVLKLENTYESGGGTATVTGNAPIIELYANDSGTAQPDSQELGIIEFRGENKDTSAEELYVRIVGTNGDANTTGELKFETQQSNTMTTALTIRGDRGLSQFTAKAWMYGDPAGIVDSHNISSFDDDGTGLSELHMTNACANDNFCALLGGTRAKGDTDTYVKGSQESYTRVRTTSSVAFITSYSNNSSSLLQDMWGGCSIAIFGD